MQAAATEQGRGAGLAIAVKNATHYANAGAFSSDSE
jgi:hypothetical protein